MELPKLTFSCGSVYCYKGSINGELTVEQKEDYSFHAYSQYGEEMVDYDGSLTGFFKKLIDILENKEA